MLYVACADPSKCGVKRHQESTVAPACGARMRGKSNKGRAIAPALPSPSLPPVAPMHQQSFPVSRSLTESGGLVWEFPISHAGKRRGAVVATERGSSVLHVTLSDSDGDFFAELAPTDPRGESSGGFIVASAVSEPKGHAIMTHVRPIEPPARAHSTAERVRLLDEDSNWVIEGEPKMKHAGASGGVVGVQPTSDRVMAAVKAARMHAMVNLVRDSIRARAQIASAPQDDSSTADLRRIDAELEDIMNNSRVPLGGLTI